MDTRTAPPRAPRERLRAVVPSRWGISTRSAAVSASVVLLALTVATAGLLAILYRNLLSAVDDASSARVGDIVAALQSDAPPALDNDLLLTDQRVVAVQVIDSNGVVVRRADTSPSTPLLPPADFGSAMTVGLSDHLSPDDDMRISGQTTTSPAGRYTVLVGGGSEAIESTIKTVAALLGIAAPAVIAAAGIASYLLVKRSLRSVDAIRARVADISTSDLTDRVPIPPSRDEIAALAVTMNEMLARIEAGHAAQRRFVGDASHELRSPLATIISTLQVVEAHPHLLNHELTSQTLVPEALRMKELLEDLLLLARADERGLPMRHEDVALDELADTEAARLRHSSTLDVHTDIDTAHLDGDVAGMSRVLRNLVDNAARHAQSRVDIQVKTRDGQAILSVADDGPGIPVAERGRVFDRFVRLESDRSRRGGGTGLGLAIVAEIVAAHQGVITIGERPAGGTTVTVTLPSRQ
jgi:signal transduction histidine kinase